MNDSDEFSKLLKKLREKNGLSIADCCKAISWKSRGAWHLYETGDREPSLTTARLMLKVVGGEIEIREKK